ncbi:hypothetical protein WICANDRAFT_95417 [Wickerhamomyces anomalus NRRL Y-366-8]|uniref:Uncharacterized protein n=1 Tax=Wickerhamomyces anomalus (strain ATCC 58044 / CBS 1984 / NCYC 433 / NRRL Y-366-8) TaxID=683960 RepID=A0A1E3NYE6_WICAA|nr:uncharacterized protein WICANDRAFT_95417 [Wickerhamomyces anomalus NRRL Y-366-8]ODQ58084.1 hypothetical protein WICANDRAFT_95417 [Wickerhamomyces anomalus NRRL Y-366-8]
MINFLLALFRLELDRLDEGLLVLFRGTSFYKSITYLLSLLDHWFCAGLNGSTTITSTSSFDKIKQKHLIE